jgi:hypothetical protein
MEYNLDSIQLNLQVEYLNNLIFSASKLDLDTSNVNKQLNKLLKNKELENNVMTEKVSETSHVDYLYLKPWNKLTIIHKIIKIKEFINNLDIADENQKDKFKDEMIELIKDKKKKCKINYDENKGKVISIPQLTFDNNRYKIV